MIIPTIGRKVWYWPSALEHVTVLDKAQALDATVIYVHDENKINLLITDHIGKVQVKTLVPINCIDNILPRAEWMPYQKAVATNKIEPTLHAEPKL